MTALDDRVRRWIARFERTHPHSHRIWTDPHDSAVSIDVDDFRSLCDRLLDNDEETA